MSLATEIRGVLRSTSREIPRSLSHQLHQTTQPLSALHGVLELALMDSRSIDDYRHAVEHALAESERLVDCFQQLRRLLENSPTPDPGFGVKHV